MCEPFCRVAVRCSPSSCFSTVAIRGFLGEGWGGRTEANEANVTEANVTDQGLSRPAKLQKDYRHSLCALV